MSITVERLHSPVYPAYLHVGEYAIALEPEKIQALREITEEEASLFLVKLIEEVGINRYLREMIEIELEKEDDQEILVKRLREDIQKL